VLRPRLRRRPTAKPVGREPATTEQPSNTDSARPAYRPKTLLANVLCAPAGRNLTGS
jgi:hypothetical protein